LATPQRRLTSSYLISRCRDCVKFFFNFFWNRRSPSAQIP